VAATWRPAAVKDGTAATAVLVALAVVMVAACAAAIPGATASLQPEASSEPSSAAPSVTPRVTSTPRPSPTLAPAIVDEFDAGGAGWGMTKAGGALWIQVDPPVDAIVRIDVETGDAKRAVYGGHYPEAGDEGLWVVSGAWLAKVDAATGDQILRIPVAGAMALADGAVWLLNEDGLYRVDAESGDVADPIGAGVVDETCSRKQLLMAFGSAWLACKEGRVIRIDVETGESAIIPTAAGAHTFAVTDDAVWVTNYQAGSVSHIDPATNEATQIQGAGGGVGITSGHGFVWAAAPNGIAKIDPATKSIVDVVDLGYGEYYELVWDDGIIWASTRTNRVLKVDPSK
jgi:hypothetical protein